MCGDNKSGIFTKRSFVLAALFHTHSCGSRVFLCYLMALLSV